MSESGELDRAFQALREEVDGQSDSASDTLTRVLFESRRRAEQRRRMVRRWVPLAAVLVGSSAWAAGGTRIVQAVRSVVAPAAAPRQIDVSVARGPSKAVAKHAPDTPRTPADDGASGESPTPPEPAPAPPPEAPPRAGDAGPSSPPSGPVANAATGAAARPGDEVLRNVRPPPADAGSPRVANTPPAPPPPPRVALSPAPEAGTASPPISGGVPSLGVPSLGLGALPKIANTAPAPGPVGAAAPAAAGLAGGPVARRQHQGAQPSRGAQRSRRALLPRRSRRALLPRRPRRPKAPPPRLP